MPRYEFVCGECSANTTVTMTISDYHPISYCTSCKTDSLKRVYAATPVQFKGAGWGGSHPQGV